MRKERQSVLEFCRKAKIMNREMKIREKYSRITQKLKHLSKTITTMESATSGMIASLITNGEGASTIFKGAFVTYCNDAKIRNGVPEEIISKYGVYSKETAAAMAKACRRFYDADIGIGVTGTFANVDPMNPDSEPGLVYFSIETERDVYSFCYKLEKFGPRFESKFEVADVLADKVIKII